MPIQTPLKKELFAGTLKSIILGVFAVVLVLFVCLGFRPQKTDAASTNSTINFQARLEASSGAIVPDGNYNVEFKLYSVSSAGTALWTEDYLNSASQGIQVINGYVTANLGSITSFPSTINWDQQLWLTVNIGGTTGGSPSWDGEMSPRLQISASPYAFRAGQLAKLTGSNTSTLDFATQTGARSILLPDESGTLCIQSSTNCGFAASSGSSSYIQNGASPQTANFNITGNGTLGGTLQAATVNATSTIKLNGTDINTAGTLTNVAYLNASSQTFSGTNVFSATGGNTLAITGAPTNSGTTSLIQIGSAISGGNTSTNGGTYIGLNAPSSGAGSAADFLNFQNNGSTKFKVDSSGNLNTNGSLLITASALTNGSIQRNFTAGSTGVSTNDVVVIADDGSGNPRVVTSTTARDPKVIGVSSSTASNGNAAGVRIAGTYQVTADTGLVNVGDQLVVSSTPGQVTVDNNATTGVLGYAVSAKSAGSSGLVSVYINTKGGQSTPVFRPTSDSSTAFRIQNAAGTNMFTVDTSGTGQLAVGPSAVPANGVLTIGTNTTAASGGIYFGTDTNLFRSASGYLKTGGNFQIAGSNLNILNNSGTLTFGTGSDTTLTRSGSGELTLNGDFVIQGGDLTTNQTTFNLLNTTATTLNIGGAVDAGGINLAGGSASTGCTIDGSNGNLTCSGNITGASTGTVGYWSRSGTTLQPATAGDAITTSGNISTSGSGTITSASTITGTTLNGTTGINTGAGAGTQRIDSNGNLLNILTLTAGVTSTATSGTNLQGNLSFTASPASAPGAQTDFIGLRETTSSSSANANSNTRLFGASTNTSFTGSGTLGTSYGNYMQSSNAGAGTITTANGGNGVILNSSNGIITTGNAINGVINNTGTGTISNARSLLASVINNGGGTLTNAYGLMVSAPNNSGVGSTIGSLYGVYIGDQTGSGITNAYGLYFAGTGTTSANGITWNGDTNLYRSAAGELTTNGDIVVQGGDITTNQTTFNLLNTTATTLNIGGAATTALNIGPSGATGTSINIAGGSAATGCTVDGATGDLTCSGNINGTTTGTIGYWSRSGTTLQPSTSGDAITTSGNISTTSTGTITSAGLLTGSAGLTVTGGTANINASGTSGSSIGNSTGTLALTGGASSTIAFTNFAVSAAGVITLQGNQTADITTTSAATSNPLTIQTGISTVASGTGASVTVKGGNQSGDGSTGGTLNLQGGDATGSANTRTGGTVSIRGGNSTGASGTRNGGSVSIDAGTGASSNGTVSIGTTNSVTNTFGRSGGTTTINGSANSTITFTNFSVSSGGNVVAGGTYNTNTFTSSALTFGAAGAATIQAASSQALNITGHAASTFSTDSGNLTLQGGSGTVSLGTSTNLTASSALSIAAGGTAQNLSLDGSTSGQVLIGGTSTGDILLGGGSASTGCTVTNSNGNLTCSGNITGASTGTVGYWSRSGTTLQPATAGDAITTSGNISTTSTGTITSAGLLTGSAGLTITGAATSLNASSNFATNINTGTSTGAVSIGNSSAGAIAIQSGSTVAITSGTTLGLTSTGANNINITPGGSSNTGVLVKPTTDSTVAFQVQNSSSNTLLKVDTSGTNVILGGSTVTNLASNPSFETDLSGWTGYFTSTRTQVNGGYVGQKALQIVTTAGNGNADGANLFLPAGLATGSYTFSTYLKSGSGTPGVSIAIEGPYSFTGSNSATQTLGSGWTRYSFTANISSWGGNSSSTKFVVKDSTTGAPSQTFLVDGVQFEASSSLTPYNDASSLGNATVSSGAVTVTGSSLNATVSNLLFSGNLALTGSSVFQTSTDSTTGFQIQKSDATALFTVDTSNSQVAIGSSAVPANGALTIGTNTTAATGGIYFGTDTNLYRSAADTLKTDDTLNVVTGYQINGTAGASVTCSGGQFLQNQVVLGGLVTGGSCTSSGGSGVNTVGAIDSQTKSANGAVISGTTIYLQTADATNVGLVSTGTQTLAGAKTFSSLLTGSAGLTITGAATSLNASSNFATNINTGTSTGAVSIGNSSAGAIAIQSGSTVAITSGTTLGLTSTGANNINITPGGSSNTGVLVKPTTDSTAAFKIQNAGATADLFTADTSNLQATLGGDLNVGSASNVGGAGRLFSDSFESGNFDLWSATSTGGTSTAAVDTATVRDGKYSGKFTINSGGQAYVDTLTSSTSSTVYLRGYVYISSASTALSFMYVYANSSGVGTGIDIYRNSSNKLCAYSDLTSTDQGCSTPTLTTGTWHKIEVAITKGSGTGVTTVTLDGTQVVNATGLNNGTANFDSIAVGTTYTNETGVEYIDDVAFDTVSPGNSTNLVVNDSFHVSGTSSFGSNVLVQPSTNSTTTFQIQNSNGDSLLNVDSKNSNVTILGNNSGDIQSWTSTSSLGSPMIAKSVIMRGYIYAITDDNNTSNTYYAKLNSDGSVGTWATTTVSPNDTAAPSIVAAGGYIYMIGGKDISSGTVLNTVYSAKQNADGTLGSWTSLSSTLTDARWDAGATVANGYIYIIGGYNSTSQDDVYYAKYNSDGTLGAWTKQAAALPANQSANGVSAANGYIYSVGGYNTNSVAVVYRAALNASTGATSSWTDLTTRPLPAARQNPRTVIQNGYIYAIGGNVSSSFWDGVGPVNTVYYAKLNTDGSLGSWSTSTHTLSNNTTTQGIAAANGYIYSVGGYTGSYLTNVYYTSGSRLQVGSSLDLVGLQAGNLNDTGAGGELTAGNTNVIGILQVQGDSSFDSSMSIAGNLSTQGNVTFQNSTDSTSAFQVLFSTGGTLIGADTVNGEVGIGANPKAGFELYVQSNGDVPIQAKNTGSADLLQLLNNTATVLSVSNSGTLTLSGSTSTFANLTITNSHFKATQTTAPTIGTPSSCGTTPTASVTAGSTDSAGSFTINSGSSTTGVCTTIITFNKAYGSAPKSVVLTGATGTAAAKTGAVTATSTTTFTVALGSASATSTAYKFYYWVIE